jgi:hypothetical protein
MLILIGNELYRLEDIKSVRISNSNLLINIEGIGVYTITYDNPEMALKAMQNIHLQSQQRYNRATTSK